MKNSIKDIIEKGISIEGTQINIIGEMIDWVRVIDKNSIVKYANKKMKDDLGNNIEGKKCYEVLGRKEKCSVCVSSYTLETGKISKKEEKIGEKIYNIISSPVKTDKGEIIAAVEVFRDITKEKELAMNLENKNKIMSSDIQFAKNMQERMLPIIGIYNGLMINYLYKPSEMLSGDIFDVYKIDHNHTGIYICDVVGHGVTASLLTIFVRQSLRAISKNETNINKIIGELHKTFLTLNLEADKYFSVFFGIYNNNSNEFKYINAGHNAIPILLRNGNITLLEARGYPISNIFDTVNYDINTVNLQEKDRLILYSDGIIEARNNEGIQFGMDRFLEIVKKEKNILNKIGESVESYTNKQTDDYAVLMMDVV